ncbi:MAG TPA: AI-2E family transporter [Pirellulales bacterium]|nr:AI-2E family transporter [Pirellulales bacterium]
MPAAPEPPIRAELRVHTLCLCLLTVVAVGFALWWLQPVLIPFVMAVFLAVAFMPLVDVLEVRCRLPRTIAVCVALLLAVLVLLATGVLVYNAGEQFTNEQNLKQYQNQLDSMMKGLAASLPLERFGIEESDFLSTIGQFLQSGVEGVLSGVPLALAAVLSKSGLVLIFLFFLLMSSVKRDRPIGGAWGEMEGRIRSYILTMTTLSGVTGILVGFVLWLFGVQAAAVFGLLTFLLNFIPNVGSFISIILPIPIVLLTGKLSGLEKFLAICIPAAIQFVIGNFFQPKLMGSHMRLHPVAILVALIFWGMLWGVVGAFLAVPITSIIRIACDRHPLTRPVANLMAGRLDALREEPVVVASDPS